MLKLLKRKKTEESNPKANVFQKLKTGLAKTRHQLGEGLANTLLGKKSLDDNLLEEIETRLLMADLGVEVTQNAMSDLQKQLARKEFDDPAIVLRILKDYLSKLLEPMAVPLVIDASHNPYVLLMIGVNGSGKTTSIGKLAKQLQNEGKSVMLAAGDTFRAAAVEQLKIWGERNNIPVIAQKTGADSASVIYDAMTSAKARGVDILIADTAGRLHTQSHLMEELKKIKRVMQKLDDRAPHETLLVLDAGIGQNALQQALQFHQAMNITGLAITKLDGTAKGGIIFAIAEKLKLPIRFIGVGEDIEDLRPFDAQEFVNALFAE